MAVYSHSRLECFENCPLQFKFCYLDKIKRQEEGIEAFLGSRFHETMEFLYKDIRCREYSIHDLLNYYENQWDKEYTDSVVITKKNRTTQDYRNIGRKCIEDYYKRYYPFTQERVLGLEREILIDIRGDGKYKMRGFIDRLSQDNDNTYEIHDYKTAGYLPEQRHFDEDRQLALYQIGVQNAWPDAKNVRLIWHYVVFDKEMISTRSNEHLEALKDRIVTLIDRIESTKEFLPKESNLCEWCVYPDLCPKRKHLYKVDSLPGNEYLNDDGVKLVNSYAEISKRKKELKNDIDALDDTLEKIKEAVIKYAEKENIEVIRGSDNKLRISTKQKVVCPAKGSQEREELETVLRAINKWNEVCELDIYVLEKIINEDTWDAEIIDKIRKFIKIEVKNNVTLSKLQDKEK
jgi:putative RecB family exonuclease